MKRILSLILILVLTVSLCACSNPNAEAEAKRLESIEAFRNYVIENGSTFGGASVLQIETEIPDVSFMVITKDDVLSMSLTYMLGTMNTKTTSVEQSTIIWLSGYEDQQDGKYYAHQTNTIKAKNETASGGFGSYIDPYTFTVSSPFEAINLTSTVNDQPKDAKLTEEMVSNMEDGVHTTLEIFADILSKSNLGLTLSDFGFVNYEIDPARLSDMRSGAWVKDPVPPAPISIEVLKLKKNSAGTPQLYINFTNTGDTTIDALDFYVRGYDAYGDPVLKYDTYNIFHGTYQEKSIAPGKSAPGSNYRYTMYGFDTIHSVEVAIVKYKLEGADAVEIPDDELVWTAG